MKFIIRPYVGAGEIYFGMTRTQIQNQLGVEPTRFKKAKDSEYETDAFEWCHVYYKSPEICEAIEFFEPAEPIFMGECLLGKSFSELKNFFMELDNDIECDEAGLTSLKYGIGIYAPFAGKEPNELVEGVIVFEKGYYD